MNTLKRIAIAAGGALLAGGASIYANSQVAAIPSNTPVNMRSANVCPTGQTTPAPCSQIATATFKFTSGGTIGVPAVLTMGASNLDFTDAGTGTCTTNGTSHVYSTNDTCTVDLNFAPLYAGTRNGAAVLKVANGAVIATALLNGTGGAPQATFSPSRIATLGGNWHQPAGVAVDGSGDVWVGDVYLKEIPAGCTSPACVISRTDLGTAFFRPAGVAVDGSGNLYVGSFGDQAIKEIPAGCTSSGCLKTLGGGFSRTSGLAVDGSGNVYIADTNHVAVKEIPAGCASSACVTTLGGGFVDPWTVAVDSSGTVYVIDYNYHLVLSLKEIPLGCASSACVKTLDGIPQPYAIAVDGSDNLYATGYGAKAFTLYEMPAGCSSSACVKTLGAGPNEPSYGMAVDGSGNIYTTSYLRPNDIWSVVEYYRAAPAALSFASMVMNSASKDSPLTLTIANDGNQDLNISGLSYAKDFPEVPGVSTDCTSSTTLATAASCTLSIDFSPLATSITGLSTSLSETVSFTDNSLNVSAVEQSVAVNGTVTVLPPALTSPNPGSTLSGSSVTFTWSAGAGPSAYQLKVGTGGFGSGNVYLGSSTTLLSALVSGIPTNGSTLYVRLKYQVGETWKTVDYTYLEASAANQPAITSPAPGHILASSSATFNWSAGTGPTSYQLKVGTTGIGSSDVYSSGATTSLSALVSGIPTNGATLYVRLLYKVGTTWSGINYIYTEPGSPTPPIMNTPVPGSTLSGSGVTFNWSAGAGPSAYQLKVGTTGVGSSDVYLGGSTTSLSVPVSSIPTNGQPVYVRLNYRVNNVWHGIDYTYTAQ